MKKKFLILLITIGILFLVYFFVGCFNIFTTTKDWYKNHMNISYSIINPFQVCDYYGWTA